MAMLLGIFSLYSQLNAEEILTQGDLSLLSCQKIYDTFFILYSKNTDSFGEIFVKEFNLNWKELREKKLGINGASAYLAYFNNRFYVSYTSFEKDGKVHIAEFDTNFNFQRDIPVNPTTYVGEWAYQMIAPEDAENLYLFCARNLGNDCGLKMIEFDKYLNISREVVLIKGNPNFHVNYSEFSPVFADNRIYFAYKKSSSESMDIFVNEYNFLGEFIHERCIEQKEKLSPSLFFDNERFYLAYEGYDDNTNKHIIYICQYDTNWNLIKKTKIVTPETGAPREKVVIASESKCYLVSISQGENLRNRIFLKEINFDLETDEVRL